MLKIDIDCITGLLNCLFCVKPQHNTPTSFYDCVEKFENRIQGQLKLECCDFFLSQICYKAPLGEMVLRLSLEYQFWLCSYRDLPNTGGEYCNGQPVKALGARKKLKPQRNIHFLLNPKKNVEIGNIFGEKNTQNKEEKSL